MRCGVGGAGVVDSRVGGRVCELDRVEDSSALGSGEGRGNECCDSYAGLGWVGI